jgi:TP901 family phage tail tape measure protein
MSRVGGALTRGLTVPLVAAGAVATKMALDFNKAFVQIQTLASKGGHSIAEMKTEVLSLAQATGQDPSGLATALYQVLSAGKAAASQAFPILTAAAKGAALGMGSVADISKVLVTTMNAYGPKTISAGEAMDVLTQATHDSAAEADALAGSLGPVIGIAAQVGVSFQDVAAAIATATNNGISAERAATGLRFLLQSLSAPTDAAKTSLDRYGISLQDLQRMLSQQGLVGTLQTLAKQFDLTSTRGQQAWKDVVGGARGAIVANTLVGKSAGAATDEVQKLGDAAGVTQQKFELWGQTITGKNAIALGKLKAAAINLGQQLIPIFEHIVNAVTGVVDAFNKLPAPMQSALVKGLLFAALAGPFLKVAGAVLNIASAFGAIGGAGAGGGLAAGAGQLALFGEAAAGASTSIGVMTVAGALAVPDIGAIGTDAITSATGMQTMQEGVRQLRGELARGEITWGEFIAGMRGLGPAAGAFNRQLDQQAALLRGIGDQVRAAGKGYQDLAPWIAQSTQLTVDQKKAIADSITKLSTYNGKLTQAQKSHLGFAIGVGDVNGALRILDHAFQQTARSGQKEAQAAREGTTKNEALSGSLKHAGSAAQEAARGANTAEGGVKSEGSAARDAQTKNEALRGSLQEVGRQHPNPKITVDNHQAMGAISAVNGALARINGASATVDIYGVYHSPALPPGVTKKAEGGIIRGASGFITRGPTYQFGEGGYSTFAGKGAEAVIPLNSRGIDILAKAVQKGGAGRSINVTINTQGSMNPEQLAASVSRHLSRTIREEALV